jgi:hydrogenase maturation protein HypF
MSYKIADTYKIVIKGVVQGVGFRPFIYKLAKENGLNGYVINSTSGVEIVLNISENKLLNFIEKIKNKAPVLSHIVSIEYEKITAKLFKNFKIEYSKVSDGVTLVSPDTAICSECKNEIFDKNDRRFLYPFTNCTNCGPRYSIIKSIPYDRKNTTMKDFQICDSCLDEYENPLGRRFHAQPNACELCGPNVFYNDFSGVDAVKKIADKINDGEIIALKGLGGYHLICDALKDKPIEKLRKLKNRKTKPFATMCKDISILERYNLSLSEAEKQILLSPSSPILIFKWPNNPLSSLVNLIDNQIGLMIAYTPLHLILFKYLKTDFIVATSGNIADEPISKDTEESEEKLSIFTKYFLHHNRDIHNRIDDSVVKILNSRIYMLRRARGFAPYPVMLPLKSKKIILSVGAHLKNTITILCEEYAFVSQYIGDLDNVESVNLFLEIIDRMKLLFKLEPDVIVYDEHLEYFSSKYALETNLEKLSLQHHYAHFLSCMAENSLTDRLIGVVFDGTGLGKDGNIWGGEFFIKDKEIIRKYYLDYSIQPSMDTAAKKPYFMLISYLIKYNLFEKYKEFLIDKLFIDETEINLIKQLIEQNINSIETSSMGRLFESVGTLLSGILENDFEAHTAVVLESMIENETEDYYDFEIEGNRIVFSKIISGIFEDVFAGVGKHIISEKFHNSIVEIILFICKKLREETGFSDICLSGGVFQNMFLINKVIDKLELAGFKVYVHSKVPPNDGSISLGQAYYYVLKENDLI